MKGLIMAGGEGTRLRPITCGKPKPMIDIMGRPVMEYIIEFMKKSDITDIAVTLMYMPQIIMDYFGDGSSFGVNLHYFIEETPLGTAGSVKNASEFLDDDFIVVSGDAVCDFDLKKITEYHKLKNSSTTLVLKKVDNPLEYGLVVTNESGKIERFLEKPDWGEVFSDMANTGIYVLSPSVLSLVPTNEKYDFSKDLFPKLLQTEKGIYGYAADGYWCDIGDISAYRQCHFDILDGKVDLDIKAKMLSKGIYMGENVQIDEAQISAPCYIGSNTIIKKEAKILPYSIIGNNCTINSASLLSKAILHRNVTVGEFSEITGAIVADGVQIDRHSYLMEDSIVGEKTHIYNMCEIKPKVKIWNNKLILSNTTVSSNVIWANSTGKNLFTANELCGEINTDITPELATRLGAAFGSMIKGKKIGLSIGKGASLPMIQNAFAAGLMSVGCTVYDFSQQLLPITRRAISFFDTDGGVHIELNDILSITFMDENGCNISRSDERKLESLYMRDDFPRSQLDDIKKVIDYTNFDKYYIQELLNETGRFNLNTLVETNDIVCKNILSLLNVNQGPGGITAEIDNFGESLLLTDEKGRKVTRDKYLALLCHILIYENEPTLVVPISYSSMFDQLAKAKNIQLLRCKTSKSDIMHTLINNKLTKQLRMMYDAYYTLAKLCKYLASTNMLLCDFTDQIPQTFVVEKDVECDFSRKGNVIRTLADTSKTSHKVELSEGVKIQIEDGWVLVIPSNEKPVCRIVTEGLTEEYANELCDFYCDEVKRLAKEDS